VTLRDHLTLKKRRTSIATYLGLVAFVVGAIVGGSSRLLLTFGLVGFAISFLSVGYMVIGIRCPVCRNRLGQLLASVGGPFSVSPNIALLPVLRRGV